jgi:hypothetical protein
MDRWNRLMDDEKKELKRMSLEEHKPLWDIFDELYPDGD